MKLLNFIFFIFIFLESYTTNNNDTRYKPRRLIFWFDRKVTIQKFEKRTDATFWELGEYNLVRFIYVYIRTKVSGIFFQIKRADSQRTNQKEGRRDLRVAHPESFNHVEMMMKRSLDGKKETKLSSFLLCRRGRKLPRASAAAAAQIFTVFYLSRLSRVWVLVLVLRRRNFSVCVEIFRRKLNSKWNRSCTIF